MQRRWRGHRQGHAYAVTWAQEGRMGTSKGLGYTCVCRDTIYLNILRAEVIAISYECL